MDDGKPSVGTICWIDLTVDNAALVREFYEQVVGLSSEPVDMGRFAVIRDPASAVAALFEPNP